MVVVCFTRVAESRVTDDFPLYCLELAVIEVYLQYNL